MEPKLKCGNLLIFLARSRSHKIGLFFRVRYETEKLQSACAYVLKLMQFVTGDKYNIVSVKMGLLFSVEHYAFAFKYEDFMLPRMIVQWAIPIRFYLEQPHGEVWGTCSSRDEPAYFNAMSPAFSIFCSNSSIVEYFHRFFHQLRVSPVYYLRLLY